MNPPDLLKLNRPPTILLYGPAGTFKTALVSQASHGKIFDFDNGMRTAAQLKDKFFALRQTVDFDVYAEPDPYNPVMFSKFKQELLMIGQKIRQKSWPFDAFIIDSLTGLAEVTKLHVMKNEAGSSFAKAQIQHWGSMVNEIEAILTTIRTFNVLTIVTAHVNIEEIDDNNMIFPMSITKKHGQNKILWLFDECWYASIQPAGQGKYSAFVQGMPTFSVKARSRGGIGMENHSEIGLRGLLSKIGYEYK